jgi:hypothetical protein
MDQRRESSTKLSVSVDQWSIKLSRYANRMAQRGLPVSRDYINLFEKLAEDRKMKEQDPEWAENNLEYDLRSTDWILSKVRESGVYAQHLYAALCNNTFQKNDVMLILQDKDWSCSWRYAGGIVADMRESGSYMDWYCSGYSASVPSEKEWDSWTTEEKTHWTEFGSKCVAESVVTVEVRDDLKRLGWSVKPQDK